MIRNVAGNNYWSSSSKRYIFVKMIRPTKLYFEKILEIGVQKKYLEKIF